MFGTYSDSECTDGVAYSESQYRAIVGDDACLTFESDCVGTGDDEDSDDGEDDGEDDDYVDCPTGVIYAQIDGDEDVELPYIPLGLCDPFGSSGSVMVECDDDGVANYYANIASSSCNSDTCTDFTCFSGPIIPELSDGNDTTTFRAACNTDVPCTFARFTSIEWNEEAGECVGDDEIRTSTVFVGECGNDG